MTPPREAAPTPSAEDERAAARIYEVTPGYELRGAIALALAAARADGAKDELEACAKIADAAAAFDATTLEAAWLAAKVAESIRARTPASDSTESAPAPAPAAEPPCGCRALFGEGRHGTACPYRLPAPASTAATGEATIAALRAEVARKDAALRQAGKYLRGGAPINMALDCIDAALAPAEKEGA